MADDDPLKLFFFVSFLVSIKEVGSSSFGAPAGWGPTIQEGTSSKKVDDWCVYVT